MHIRLRGLVKNYISETGPICALHGLDWDAEPGKVYGILGPNGSGKTSIIKIILNLIRADAGYVEINGQRDANKTSAFRAKLGYLPEERGLYRKDSAIEVLTYFARLKGLSRADAQSSSKQFLRAFDLEEYATAPLESFSKGMSQKIQFIMALIHKPTLAILDEPFTGLDPLNVRLVRANILEMKKRGALVIISTHRMDEAERLCDDILMLRDGKIALSGTQNSLRQQHSKCTIKIRSSTDFSSYSSVSSHSDDGLMQTLRLKNDFSKEDFLSELHSKQDRVQEIHITPVSLEELYVHAAEKL